MANILDLDTAWNLPIVNIYEKTSFEFTLNRFLNDNVTGENWPAQSYEFAISATLNGAKKLMSFTQASGQLVLSGSQITITCLAPANLMSAGTYYYSLVADMGSGIKIVEGEGTILVKSNRAK